MKRKQILDAAYVVFSRKGYHRATVDEIIALADTGKGTVYKYFVNKEQLFFALIRERSLKFDTEIDHLATQTNPPLEKVKQAVKVFLEFYTANAELWRVLMHEVRGFGRDGSATFSDTQIEKYRERFKHTIGVLEGILKEGIAQGVIRKCDVHKAAHGLFSVIIMMVFQGFVDEKKESIDSATESITDVFLYGVAKS